MRNAERHRRAIAAAYRLYNWYERPTNDPDVLDELLPARDIYAIYNVRFGFSMALATHRAMQTPEFANRRRQLLDRWCSQFNSKEPLTLDAANRFLKHYANLINHGLLYQKELIVGATVADRGFPPSDFAVAYHSDRSAWTLHFVTKGNVRYHAGIEIRGTPGDLLLISPRASLHYHRDADCAKWEHYWALFEPPPAWKDLMSWNMCAYGVYRLEIRSTAQERRMRSLFEEMLDVSGSGVVPDTRLITNLFEQFLIRANNSYDGRHHSRTDSRVLEACHFIETHLAEPVRVADVAQHCNLSESRLAHLFNENLNQSVKGFHDSLRMQRAKRMLATSTMPVGQVGEAVGYGDPALFSKFFRRCLGCSPRDFRNTFSQINR